MIVTRLLGMATDTQHYQIFGFIVTGSPDMVCVEVVFMPMQREVTRLASPLFLFSILL